MVRGVGDYEFSYEVLKLIPLISSHCLVRYEPSYKGLKPVAVDAKTRRLRLRTFL